MGYEPFNVGIILDHQGMFLDLSVGKHTESPDQLQRKLNSKQGNQVKKYWVKVMKNFKKKQIIQGINKLLTVLTWKHQDMQGLQQLDHDITKIMLKAEQQSIPKHTVTWSPKIQQAYNKLNKIQEFAITLGQVRIGHF